MNAWVKMVNTHVKGRSNMNIFATFEQMKIKCYTID